MLSRNANDTIWNTRKNEAFPVDLLLSLRRTRSDMTMQVATTPRRCSQTTAKTHVSNRQKYYPGIMIVRDKKQTFDVTINIRLHRKRMVRMSPRLLEAFAVSGQHKIRTCLDSILDSKDSTIPISLYCTPATKFST